MCRPSVYFVSVIAVGLSAMTAQKKKGSDQTVQQADTQLERARWKMRQTGGLAGWAAGMPVLGFS